jgi:dynein heavy chain
MSTPDKITTGGQFARLWRHECNRIFMDRLATVEDVKVVNTELNNIITSQFSADFEAVQKDPCIFGDFELALDRIAEDAEDPRLYSDMGNFQDIRKTFDSIMDNYNTDNKPMTLVLFEMALSHLVRIMRIIKTPRGNALLIGIGGSGKQVSERSERKPLRKTSIRATTKPKLTLFHSIRIRTFFARRSR